MEWPKNGPGVARGPQFSIAKYTVCLLAGLPEVCLQDFRKSACRTSGSLSCTLESTLAPHVRRTYVATVLCRISATSGRYGLYALRFTLMSSQQRSDIRQKRQTYISEYCRRTRSAANPRAEPSTSYHSYRLT